MAGVNKAILIGNLGRDPELRFTPNGQPVATFSLATSFRWKDKNGQPQDRTDWHNIVVFGRQAEVCKEYLKKGRLVYLEGRIQNRTYEDKDGVKKYRSEIIVTQMTMLGRMAAEPEEIEETAEAELETPQQTQDDDLPF
jgi:single-strand DNA-binding protein